MQQKKKKIENCKQEVQAAQIFIQKQQDCDICTSCLQISIFFSTMLVCFKNPSSLLFRQVCIVSCWSCKFLKLCQKKCAIFVPDFLGFLTHCFTLIRLFMCHQSHFLGSYNDQAGKWPLRLALNGMLHSLNKA
jgi:hypothetical protein